MTYNTFTNAQVPFLQYTPPPPTYTLTSILSQGLCSPPLAFLCWSNCCRPANWLNEAFKSSDWCCTIYFEIPPTDSRFPSPRSLWTKGAGYVGVYLPKTAYILPFLVNTGWERHRDRHSVSMCLFAVWEWVEGEGVIPSWDWIRGGIVFASPGVSQLRPSDMRSGNLWKLFLMWILIKYDLMPSKRQQRGECRWGHIVILQLWKIQCSTAQSIIY